MCQREAPVPHAVTRLAGSWRGNQLVLAPFPCPSPRWQLAAEFWCPQGKVNPSASSLAHPPPPGPRVLVMGRVLHRCCWGLHLILVAGDLQVPPAWTALCLVQGGSEAGACCHQKPAHSWVMSASCIPKTSFLVSFCQGGGRLGRCLSRWQVMGPVSSLPACRATPPWHCGPDSPKHTHTLSGLPTT